MQVQEVSWLVVVSCFGSINHVWQTAWSQIAPGVASFFFFVFFPLSWTFTNWEVISHVVFLSVLLILTVPSSVIQSKCTLVHPLDILNCPKLEAFMKMLRQKYIRIWSENVFFDQPSHHTPWYSAPMPNFNKFLLLSWFLVRLLPGYIFQLCQQLYLCEVIHV